MLKDKGVVHFFQMAQALRKEKSGATCVLVGGIDPDNPSSLSKQQIDAMTATGEIEWWGYRKDIPEVLRKAAIVCLFSLYGEGVPKALLEAASCGKPLVAYDVPGCREIVRDGYNGFLIPRDDVYAATNALKHLITNPDLRAEMGRRSRQIVISEFSETIVNTKTLKVYQEIVFG
jgi:glycosyltransferase involved in cell wall biosynthesis